MTMVIDDDCETTTVRVVIASRYPRFSARQGTRWSVDSSVCCNRQCASITQAACRRRSAAAGGGGRTRWDAEECGSLLDVVIRKCKVILKLLAIEDQILLVQKKTCIVLDLYLDVVDSIGYLDVQGNGCCPIGHEDGHIDLDAHDNDLSNWVGWAR